MEVALTTNSNWLRGKKVHEGEESSLRLPCNFSSRTVLSMDIHSQRVLHQHRRAVRSSGVALMAGIFFTLCGATSAFAQDVQPLLDPLRAVLADPAEGGNSHLGKEYNIIFVSLTNTRADHLGVYGYSRNTSTNIDQFARKSLVFKNAFSHASWTLPVAISLFTSQYPFTHKLMNREDATMLHAAVPTFLDVLKENVHSFPTRRSSDLKSVV